jgi:hypothetical protein
MKYKPCCGTRCLLGNCDTREAGGCYCVCRLVDAKHSCEKVLDGSMFVKNNALIYVPGHYTDLTEEERANALHDLEEINLKLKDYETLDG